MSTSTRLHSSQLLCQHGEERGDCATCQPAIALQTLNTRLDQLLAAARPRLLHLAIMSGIASDQAEDVVQETAIEAWRHLENLREPAKFSSWLDGICRNVCLRHLRTRSVQRSHEVSLLTGQDDRDETPFDLPDPFVIDPHEDLFRQDMHLLLDRALGYLPTDTRELVERCYLAEQPQREVALQMGMSIGALELKLYRARQQLSQVLRGDMRVDMQEFGFFLNEDESSGWQETPYWCWLCGKQRMRAHLITTPVNKIGLRLRCPDCSRRYDTNLLESGDISVRGGSGSRTFRPAFKRIMHAIGDFYHQTIYEQRCPICQSSIHIRLINNDNSVNDIVWAKKVPASFYACIDCPLCGQSITDLAGLHIYKNEMRSFLLDHSHVTVEPAVLISYNGQDAISSRLVDSQTGEAITMITHPQTLHLLATLS